MAIFIERQAVQFKDSSKICSNTGKICDALNKTNRVSNSIRRRVKFCQRLSKSATFIGAMEPFKWNQHFIFAHEVMAGASRYYFIVIVNEHWLINHEIIRI